MLVPFDEEIVLENDRVRLRPLSINDFDHLLPIALEDKDLLQYSPKPIYSAELLITYLKQAEEGRLNRTRYAFSVFDKRTQQYAGSTGFLHISEADDRLEIGHTWYGKAFRRTGLNRNCKYLLLQYAFEVLKAVRVEFRVDERNTMSCKALEKIGALREGILRKHTLLYDGHRRNTVCYSILDTEWAVLKPTFLLYPKS